jgi:ActR/RegA family two-component response regulator
MRDASHGRDTEDRQALIIDDDDQVRSIVARWLTAVGYTVTAINAFDDALTALTAHIPDVLVIDVRLGAFNGLQLAIRARETRRDVRIAIVSGWDDPTLRVEAIKCGAAYLCKPLSSNQLFDALGIQMDHPHALAVTPTLRWATGWLTGITRAASQGRVSDDAVSSAARRAHALGVPIEDIVAILDAAGTGAPERPATHIDSPNGGRRRRSRRVS